VTTNEEVGYLIEELHASGRWPIKVFKVGYELKGNMYTEINQHCSYIIQISETCLVWELYERCFLTQLRGLMYGSNSKHSWDPRAKFVVPVMYNCTQLDNKIISRAILNILWEFEILNATVLFLNSNKHAGNDLEQNTTDSAQGTYLELHT
jgi:hypothetical protein